MIVGIFYMRVVKQAQASAQKYKGKWRKSKKASEEMKKKWNKPSSPISCSNKSEQLLLQKSTILAVYFPKSL